MDDNFWWFVLVSRAKIIINNGDKKAVSNEGVIRELETQRNSFGRSIFYNSQDSDLKGTHRSVGAIFFEMGLEKIVISSKLEDSAVWPTKHRYRHTC
jgi:hypothetical protein